MPTKPSSNRIGSYFSLPGELRNQVMEELLVPGDVWVSQPPQLGIALVGHVDLAVLLLTIYVLCGICMLGEAYMSCRQPPTHLRRFVFWGFFLCVSYLCVIYYWYRTRSKFFSYRYDFSLKRKKAGKNNSVNSDGYQFLAASKQVSEEGRSIFYSQNVFHLPPGPLSNTQDWFDGLREDHRKTMGTLVCDFSLLDLEPYIVHAAYFIAYLLKKTCRRGSNLTYLWRVEIMNYLWETWLYKVYFILKRENKTDQESLRDKVSFLLGLKEKTRQQSVPSKYIDEMQTAFTDLDRLLVRKIRDLGPQGTKTWLIRREYGEDIVQIHTSKGLLKRVDNS